MIGNGLTLMINEQHTLKEITKKAQRRLSDWHSLMKMIKNGLTFMINEQNIEEHKQKTQT